MSDIVNSFSSVYRLDGNRVEHGHIYTVRPTGQILKNIINTKQQPGMAQLLSPVAPLAIERIIKNKQSNNVKDLNLIINSINQLTIEVMQKIIYHQNMSKHYGFRNYPYTGENECYQDACNEGNVARDNSDIIELYITILLIKIQTLLQTHKIMNSYKIIIIYQLVNDSNICFKRLTTIIPYESGIPLDGFSEIAIYETNGLVKKIKNIAKLICGGFRYTKDWLSFCVTDEINQKNIQKIRVYSDNEDMTGFTTNYNLEIPTACQQVKFNMHVQDFASNWD
jgi:hypothetical protein